LNLYNATNATLIRMDCVDALRKLGANRVDALVTDPPAGISFMGRAWDSDRGGRDEWVAWLTGVMRECYRVMKPGAHGLVWALPRTSHWTGWALESAGFEVRDVVTHLFGTGFPKSLNVGKALDSWTGNERDETDEPASQWSKRFDGWGTALKPASEHWILIRKPLDGTVAGNVAAYGTGALNIDACRIDGAPRATHGTFNRKGSGASIGPTGLADGYESAPPAGRWPANVTLDEEAAALLDEQSGTLKSGSFSEGMTQQARAAQSKGAEGARTREARPADSGGASRFFYCAKPSGKERDAGCEHLPVKSGGEATDREDDSAGVKNPRAGAGRGGGRRNHHPTVKSIALMRWLIRLITPPGGLVLDPFAGSGSTGVAALAEGARFIGIEREPEYFDIAKARLEHAA
jgi:DNA modification methylase